MSILNTVVRRNRPRRYGNLFGASQYEACLVNKLGRAFTWGQSASNGQLGNNSTVITSSPVSVCGAVKTFCKIAGGGNQFLAIDKNGLIWGWGQNFGYLGNNSTINTSTPVSVAGARKTFCEIAAGRELGAAIDKNGRLWSWGQNYYGELGTNNVGATTSRSTPVSVCGAVKTFCKIASTQYSLHAIDKNGRVWCWGDNGNAQLGNSTFTNRSTPVSVLGAIKTFCQITGACRGNHCMVIDKNGRVWGWGGNFAGKIGNNSVAIASTPVAVGGALKTFCKISAGSNHTLAIDKNGRVWAWGENAAKLGNFDTANRCTPVSVCGAVKTFCTVLGNQNGSFAVDKNGRVWGWGYYFNIGIPFVSAACSPVSVCGVVKTFCNISTNTYGCQAIDKNGKAWTWGYNAQGQLGINNLLDKPTPVSILGTTKTFCTIDGGNTYTTALDKNGKIWSWGINQYGQLGDNSIVSRLTPVALAGTLKTFCKIATGGDFAFAIDKNGRLWSWGGNYNGQLGTNSITNRSTPVSVLGTVKTFCELFTGVPYGIFAIDKNGRLWAWGSNASGLLGDNTIVQKSTPVSVAGAIKTFCKISANSSALALEKNGRLWTWGANGSGQLGDNSITSKSTPVSVGGVAKTFCQIATGTNYCLAIDKNGRVWAWGTNSNGELGDGTKTNKSTPVSVGGLVKTFCKISAQNGSIAVDKNGRVWCWGTNFAGSLGTNNLQTAYTPTQIPVV